MTSSIESIPGGGSEPEPNYEGVGFDKILDAELARIGHHSMERLSVALEAGGDLNQKQVYDRIKGWRREVGAGLTFDLAVRVVVALPGMLKECARRGGSILVPRLARAGVTNQEAFQAATNVTTQTAGALAALCEGISDKKFTADELARLESRIDNSIAALELVREIARACREGRG